MIRIFCLMSLLFLASFSRAEATVVCDMNVTTARDSIGVPVRFTWLPGAGGAKTYYVDYNSQSYSPRFYVVAWVNIEKYVSGTPIFRFTVVRHDRITSDVISTPVYDMSFSLNQTAYFNDGRDVGDEIGHKYQLHCSLR